MFFTILRYCKETVSFSCSYSRVMNKKWKSGLTDDSLRDDLSLRFVYITRLNTRLPIFERCIFVPYDNRWHRYIVLYR